MNIQDFIALAVLGFGLAGFIWHEFSKLGDKIDKDIKEQSKKIDAQAARTDRLYEMFIDLLNKKG